MQAVAASDYGKYREIKSEKELIAASAWVLHFLRDSLTRDTARRNVPLFISFIAISRDARLWIDI